MAGLTKARQPGSVVRQPTGPGKAAKQLLRDKAKGSEQGRPGGS